MRPAHRIFICHEFFLCRGMKGGTAGSGKQTTVSDSILLQTAKTCKRKERHDCSHRRPGHQYTSYVCDPADQAQLR
jgi:hypothetical protein